MTLRQKLRTAVAGLGLVGTLATGTQAGVFRVDAMDDRTTVDVRHGFSLTPTESPVKLDAFMRARVHSPYDGKSAYGAFVDVNTDLGHGLLFTVEANSATNTRPYLNVGLTYAGQAGSIGNVLFFPNITATGERHPFNTVLNIDRKDSVYGRDVVTRFESLTSWNTEGSKPFASAEERLRVGLDVGYGIFAGPAIDAIQTTPKGKFKEDYRFGGFIQKNF